MVNPGRLLWTGEHWICYLRIEGQKEDAGKVSLYHTHYSPAGEGTVAFVVIGGDPPFQAILTDNRSLTGYINEVMRHPFDIQMPVHDARFSRTGEVAEAPGWILRTREHEIVATWSAVQSPVIAELWAPFFREDKDLFSLLFFSDRGAITIDGRPIAGAAYSRDIWMASIGGMRSSCVFALAETIIQVDK